jgi:hypothetical protein
MYSSLPPLCSVHDSPRGYGIRGERFFYKKVASFEKSLSVGSVSSGVSSDNRSQRFSSKCVGKEPRIVAFCFELSHALRTSGYGDHLYPRNGSEHPKMAHADRPGTENEDSYRRFAHQCIQLRMQS